MNETETIFNKIIKKINEESDCYIEICKSPNDCTKSFYIIEQWDDLALINKTILEFYPKITEIRNIKSRDNYLFEDWVNYLVGYDNWGTSESYLVCNDCGKAIYIGDNSKVNSYTNTYGDIYCIECFKKNEDMIKEYLERLTNNFEIANTLLTDDELIKLGYSKLESFSTGWYERNDNKKPEDILKNLSYDKQSSYIFSIDNTNMFETCFSVWECKKNS